jgi:hypothetical protein
LQKGEKTSEEAFYSDRVTRRERWASGLEANYQLQVPKRDYGSDRLLRPLWKGSRFRENLVSFG